MLLLPKVIDRGIVSVTCTTNEAVCRRRMAVALRGGYGWHQRYWNGLREKRRRLTLSACCRRRRSRRLHVLHLRRIYNSRERGRLHRGRPLLRVLSGTCNKDFPRLWTQLAGRPRNRYSAGIRSFRSTSPPFLIGVLRRPSYVTLPAQSNVQGGENMSESQEQTAVVEYCDIKALEQ